MPPPECRREGIAAVTKDTDKINAKFLSCLLARELTLHFLLAVILNKRELLSSYHLPLLCVLRFVGLLLLSVESGKSGDQLEVLIKLTEESGVKEFIMAIAFDTTASNTGVHSGAVTLVD